MLDLQIVKHKEIKVARCAIFLYTFQYIIEDVDGVDIVIAGIMMRWMRDYREPRSVIKRVTKQIFEHEVVP